MFCAEQDGFIARDARHRAESVHGLGPRDAGDEFHGESRDASACQGLHCLRFGEWFEESDQDRTFLEPVEFLGWEVGVGARATNRQ